MIKIIEPGTKKIAVCNDCGCKFSYEQIDIQTTPPDPLRLVGQEEFVICPQCHKRYTVRTIR